MLNTLCVHQTKFYLSWYLRSFVTNNASENNSIDCNANECNLLQQGRFLTVIAIINILNLLFEKKDYVDSSNTNIGLLFNYCIILEACLCFHGHVVCFYKVVRFFNNSI